MEMSGQLPGMFHSQLQTDPAILAGKEAARDMKKRKIVSLLGIKHPLSRS
jgi:hypothetical protein